MFAVPFQKIFVFCAAIAHTYGHKLEQTQRATSVRVLLLPRSSCRSQDDDKETNASTYAHTHPNIVTRKQNNSEKNHICRSHMHSVKALSRTELSRCTLAFQFLEDCL